MQVGSTNKIQRQFSSLLNEHWKRKQRLKPEQPEQEQHVGNSTRSESTKLKPVGCCREPASSASCRGRPVDLNGRTREAMVIKTSPLAATTTTSGRSDDDDALGLTFCDQLQRLTNTSQSRGSQGDDEKSQVERNKKRGDNLEKQPRRNSNPIIGVTIDDNTSDNQRNCCAAIPTTGAPLDAGPVSKLAALNKEAALEGLGAKNRRKAPLIGHTSRCPLWRHSHLSGLLLWLLQCNHRLMVLLSLLMLSLTAPLRASTSDPRPTIYSGQVSFGLLLSAHSSMGTELSTSASSTTSSRSLAPPAELPGLTMAAATAGATTTTPTLNATAAMQPIDYPTAASTSTKPSVSLQANQSIDLFYPSDSAPAPVLLAPGGANDDEQPAPGESQPAPYITQRHRSHDKRQIFERISQTGAKQNAAAAKQTPAQAKSAAAATLAGQTSGELTGSLAPTCGQVNSNALYAGMSAIWASHQANLVGDSPLNIGTYVYDSCNDLDVGQRQAVRIVSNLNAFQQTTCEAPRGSPISLTIAHGDNQLRAIQLLTSFKVPVITTKEHFALEDYNQLSRDQRKFLFTTAPSSRHLAIGSLKFSKRIVSRSTSSIKLDNQFYKTSSRNGLIVISRNLPSRFINYLAEMIPNYVNYEMIQSSQPIDQIKSTEVLEGILVKNTVTLQSSASTTSNLRIPVAAHSRRERGAAMNDDSDSGQGDGGSSGAGSGGGGGDFDIPGEGENPKMLSPTILMFITPSEAIDLVTRLRNDLLEVSKYYSLIVSTREDISPALKTIFHRGGSRLCSGKAFYTISPKPDDISEFSRYFRDTVHMESETSDHPLICEYAKYISTSKLSTDLDDISAEPVIKAVWAAAAAFKSVYKSQCPSASPTSQPNGYKSATGTSHHHHQDGDGNLRQTKSTPTDCMSKLNKVMSSLMQKSLKKLNLSINSTGLQSLDGFHIKFDAMNELETNKFSIKYINKECEIVEIGQFSGIKDSNPRYDEDLLVKSLETTLPDPWPVVSTPAPTTQSSSTSSSSTLSGNLQSADDKTSASDSNKLDSVSSGDDGSSGDGVKLGAGDSSDSSGSAGEGQSARRRQKSVSEETDPSDDDPSASDKSNVDDSEAKRPSKRSRSEQLSGSGRLARRNKADPSRGKAAPPGKQTAPVTATGGRGIVPGLTDTEDADPVSDLKALAPIGDTEAASKLTTSMRKLKLYPTTINGAALKDWLPTTTVSNLNALANSQPTTRGPNSMRSSIATTRQQLDDEQVDSGGTLPPDLRTRGTTQAPIFTTLPESGGNADLELPPRTPGTPVAARSGATRGRASMDASATTEASEYVTLPSISQPYSTPRSPYPAKSHRNGFSIDGQSLSIESDGNPLTSVDPTRFNYLRDINSSPVPLNPSVATRSTIATTTTRSPSQIIDNNAQYWSHIPSYSPQQQSGTRSKLRSQLRWIYSSWFALSILAANVCGALFTLYVLTFLLMKNCDGSLDRESQGIRSMHLLAIIVVFFGSTLFIVYPTPGLCLLRNSWHNFSLVLLFGSLLLQTMQTRSLSSLGLGGRPNRLNQFLTLVFMVGVQVSFELQKWKYESSSYLQFVHQYFGSSEGGDTKLSALSSSLASQFNPMNSFNDQVTPVSIQVSEKYQSLLQDYCSQHTDEFIQSQIYLFIIVGLLIIFSISTRKSRRLPGGGGNSSHHRHLTSGKIVASQHETNLTDLTHSSQFQFSSNVANANTNARNLFIVTLITTPIYLASILLHVYGHNHANHDLIFSITMVLVAFTTLIGIFLPVLRQVHRYEDLMSERISGTISRPVMSQSKLHELDGSASAQNSAHSAFAMFPEFAQTGLRRPSSVSGDSSSGAGSRRPFAETKESRRNMGVALANLGPSADSLRSMGFYGDSERSGTTERPSVIVDPALLNLKLNLSANEELSPIADDLFKVAQQVAGQHQSSRRNSRNEKRLIMLDVDPCCPRHGIATRPTATATTTTTSTATTSKDEPLARRPSNNGTTTRQPRTSAYKHNHHQ